jgi:hypothetical protein
MPGPRHHLIASSRTAWIKARMTTVQLPPPAPFCDSAYLVFFSLPMARSFCHKELDPRQYMCYNRCALENCHDTHPPPTVLDTDDGYLYPWHGQTPWVFLLVTTAEIPPRRQLCRRL